VLSSHGRTMTSVYVKDEAYLEFNKRYGIEPEYFDYTAFYVIITIATILAVILIAINIFYCCCSEHSAYWSDPDTGNRFASFLFVRGPKQKPMDVLLV